MTSDHVGVQEDLSIKPAELELTWRMSIGVTSRLSSWSWS